MCVCVNVPQKPLGGCLARGNPIPCFMGRPVGLEEGSGQHRLGERADSPEGRETLLPILILPRPVCTCPCPFHPTQCSLSRQLSTQPQALVCQTAPLPSTRRDRTGGESSTPLFPTSGKGLGEGPPDLSLNSTPIYRSSKGNKVLCSA